MLSESKDMSAVLQKICSEPLVSVRACYAWDKSVVQASWLVFQAYPSSVLYRTIVHAL
jgi:hypothetical protein